MNENIKVTEDPKDWEDFFADSPMDWSFDQADEPIKEEPGGLSDLEWIESQLSFDR